MPRFYKQPEWWFVVTDLDGSIVTLLNSRVWNRSLAYHLGAPSSFDGLVSSKDPELNILHTDDYPFLAEGVRLVYGMRIERSTGETERTCRFGGLIMDIKDAGNADFATSTFTAFDPWQYLYNRPVRRLDGEVPPLMDVTFVSTTHGDQMALQLLKRTIDEDGFCFIDAGVTWGGTSFYAGTLESTPPIPQMSFQRGSSVGQAWSDLAATGTIDIVLEPIYDPMNRPGYLAELSIYRRYGDYHPEAQCAWDLPGHSLVSLDREIAGQERANVITLYSGQGGPPRGTQIDGSSVATYGTYYGQQFIPAQPNRSAVEALAARELSLRSRGLETFTLSPTPERAPFPFTEMYIGDTVPVFASANFRQAVATLERVYSLGLNISDDGLESMSNVLVTPEFAEGS